MIEFSVVREVLCFYELKKQNKLPVLTVRWQPSIFCRTGKMISLCPDFSLSGSGFPHHHAAIQVVKDK